MSKHGLAARAVALTAVLLSGLLSGCAGLSGHTPVAGSSAAIDTNAYAPTVDSFVVLLDSSGSMRDTYEGAVKAHTAQDLVATFNAAVPDYDFKASLVIFGKGADSCIGEGVATEIYAYGDYDRSGFATALGSILCAASTTPVADAMDITTANLDPEGGPVAVYIVSDFRWTDPDRVAEAVADLRFLHGHNLCLHTIKIGEFAGNDDLIMDMTENAGCGTASNAADVEAMGMSDYVVKTMMAPLAYEQHSLSATALFGFDDATLTVAGRAELDRLVAHIKGQGLGVADIDVMGHTCSIGTEEYNRGLSQRRANAVRDYLGSRGLDAGIIDATGMGESQPVASNASKAGREQNRRVAINVGTSRPSAR